MSNHPVTPTVDDIFARRGLHGTDPSIASRIDATGDCWEWTGYRDRDGYGTVSYRDTKWLVHRIVWEALVGPIPDGLEVDHLCRNRSCCNPDHLEPVSCKENIRRGVTGKATGLLRRAKTHCPHGHPYSGDNLYLRPSGSRECRICNRNSRRASRTRR